MRLKVESSIDIRGQHFVNVELMVQIDTKDAQIKQLAQATDALEDDLKTVKTLDVVF